MLFATPTIHLCILMATTRLVMSNTVKATIGMRFEISQQIIQFATAILRTLLIGILFPWESTLAIAMMGMTASLWMRKDGEIRNTERSLAMNKAGRIHENEH